jgi:ABC-type uncharacterized transport system substrate-binding protein
MVSVVRHKIQESKIQNRNGRVIRLARPGGNVTGVTSISSELAGKRLELLREIFPALARVAILAVPESDAAAGHAPETDTAARAMGLELQSMEVSGPESIDSAFQTVRRRALGHHGWRHE